MSASVRPCVRPSFRLLTLSNTNIPKTSGPVTIKFYLKHYWGGEKAALGFEPDRIRTPVFMATYSSHRGFSSVFFNHILLILSGNNVMHESTKEFEIRLDPNTHYGVNCPLASEKIPIYL